jgi:hypothetical protein
LAGTTAKQLVWEVYSDGEPYSLLVVAPTRNRARAVGAVEFGLDFTDRDLKAVRAPVKKYDRYAGDWGQLAEAMLADGYVFHCEGESCSRWVRRNAGGPEGEAVVAGRHVYCPACAKGRSG